MQNRGDETGQEVVRPELAEQVPVRIARTAPGLGGSQVSGNHDIFHILCIRFFF